MDRDLDVYKLQLDNPLVVTAASDRDAVMKAWAALHPDKEPRKLTTEKSWMSMDKQNSVALKKSNYDGIIYKIDGKVKEIQIPKEWAGRLNKVTTNKHMSTVTKEATLERVRNIASNNEGQTKETLGKAIEKAYSGNKTYTAEYVPYMGVVVIRKRSGTGLEKSRSSVYYKFTQSANGKWFARPTSGEESA